MYTELKKIALSFIVSLVVGSAPFIVKAYIVTWTHCAHQTDREKKQLQIRREIKMSSVFRFIKRKFQPFKKQLTCTLADASSSSRSSSFERAKPTPEKTKKQHSLCIRSKAIRKRSKSNAKRNAVKARHVLQTVHNWS